MNDARAIAEETARASYGRLIAYLSARTRDIAEAEDALSEAFAAALAHWPRAGVPSSPEAWLLTAARRKIIDGARRADTRRNREPDILLAIQEAQMAARDEIFADERLKLLFICAHPAIDTAVRTPLMLQTVLGLDAARIASAFLVSPATMSQRLVRAKAKIAGARISFETPNEAELQSRAAAVLDAIYAAFGAGYDSDGAQPEGASLIRESMFLARLAATLLPDDAEAQGLCALICYIDARRSARRRDGAYVPLDRQDISLWRRDLIDEADEALERAAGLKSPGRYQLEAAIQSAHIFARLSGEDSSSAVLRLYERLIVFAPSIGAEIGRAAALTKCGRADEALAALDGIDPARIGTHQPYWATRAHALAAARKYDEAREAFSRAIGLSSDAAAREFLRQRVRTLSQVRDHPAGKASPPAGPS